MFMPNITINSYKLIYKFKATSARATCKRRSGSEGGDRAWAGPRGGGPPGPSGGALCALVPPRGGWGAEKAAFSTV